MQDSLGGNTKTVMVACVGPADYNYDETMSTLRYANRAKNIKNKPKINEDPKDALLRQFQDEIARLQQMLEASGGNTAVGGNQLDVEQLQQMKAATEQAEAEKAEMMALLERERAEREAIDAQLAALKAKLVSGVGSSPAKSQLLSGPTSPAAVAGESFELGYSGSASFSNRHAEVKAAQEAAAYQEQQLYHDSDKYTSLQEEVDEKTAKLDKLRRKLKAANREMEDLQVEFQDERDDFIGVC